jgi:hypothetical protein
MVIMFRAGQLGNQLFQYCALRSNFPGQNLLLIGMLELQQVFSCERLLNKSVSGRITAKLLWRIGYESVVRFAEKTRFFQLAYEKITPTGPVPGISPGLFSFVTLLKEGFYQSESSVQGDVVPSFKNEVMERASGFLADNAADRRNLYFLHHRRGDYLTWLANGKSAALLDQQWYNEQMTHIKKLNREARFVVLSDDTAYARSVYASRSDCFVSNENAGVDLAVMSCCGGGGILSASSFSWWGAYFSRKTNHGGVFIAPKYWLGHQTKKWFPPCIQTSWIMYRDVK